MFRGMILLFAASAGAWALTIADGAAQSNPFDRLVSSQTGRDEPSVWFDRADGRGRFVFDRSSQPALVWVEGAQEVFAVQRASAAGGGDVWVTDTEKVLLRVSRIGGWTYFPDDRPDGVAVEPMGRAHTLVAAPASAAQLQGAARDMADRLARLSRQNVRAELAAPAPDQNAYIIDTMVMVTLAAEQASRRSLRDLEVVRIGVGEAPRASFDGRTLDISVNTALGYGGRPSAAHIRRTLEQAAS
ncbi:MAG: DUF4908 domain-containing protein [Alphaproteobacteria bacterium]|nr:DUF4908 domain-containing protein [Alphaproteobacteria bacterium]